MLIVGCMNIRLVAPELDREAAAKQWESAIRRIDKVIDRVRAMDPDALARVRTVDNAVDIFFSTPTGTIYAQRLPGSLEPVNDAVVKARDLGEALPSARSSRRIDVGPTVDLLWRGALPPVTGYTVLETPPGSVVRQLYKDMAAESREHSGPAGIARSLLDQELMHVAADSVGDSANSPSGSPEPVASVAITGRMVATMGALGLAPEPTNPALAKYDLVRISAQGSWIRIDGLGGSLFTPRPGGLARVP